MCYLSLSAPHYRILAFVSHMNTSHKVVEGYGRLYPLPNQDFFNTFISIFYWVFVYTRYHQGMQGYLGQSFHRGYGQIIMGVRYGGSKVFHDDPIWNLEVKW